MTLRKLEKREDGNFVCPECGKPLRFKDGETVAVIDGQLDMENYKPRYICDDCQVYYRSVLTTDYYDVFPLDDAEPSKEANGNPEASAETPQGADCAAQGTDGQREMPRLRRAPPVCGRRRGACRRRKSGYGERQAEV